jgi:hypothetical protein
MDSRRSDPGRAQAWLLGIFTVLVPCGVAWYLGAPSQKWPVGPAYIACAIGVLAGCAGFIWIWDVPVLGTRRWDIAEAIEDALADLTGLLRNRSDVIPDANSDRAKHKDPCRHVHGSVDYQRQTVVMFRDGPRKPLALAVRRAVRWKWATTDDAQRVYGANTVPGLWDVVDDISKIVREMRGEPI